MGIIKKQNDLFKLYALHCNLHDGSCPSQRLGQSVVQQHG